MRLDLRSRNPDIRDFVHQLRHLFLDQLQLAVLSADGPIQSTFSFEGFEAIEREGGDPFVSRATAETNHVGSDFGIEDRREHVVQCVVGEGDENDGRDFVSKEYADELHAGVTLQTKTFFSHRKCGVEMCEQTFPVPGGLAKVQKVSKIA